MRIQNRRPLPRLAAAALMAGALLAGLGAAPSAAYPDRPGTAAVDGECEGDLLRLHNQARVQGGLPALREDPAFDQVARAWAFHLASAGTLAHNPDYGTQVGGAVPGWRSIGENVGTGASGISQHTAYMNSPGHRANIMATKYQRVAVACVRDRAGRVWTVVNFVGHPTAIADRRPAPFFSGGDASGRLRWWLLGAGPDRSTVESDTASLLGGRLNAKTFASSLAGSSTHSGTVPGVTRLYYATFLRHPDASGLTHWIRTRQGGATLDSIARQFVASPEFVRTYGELNDKDFVDQIYRNVLRREPDASGSAYWVAQLAAGSSRAKVLIGFSESKEHKNTTRADVIVSWAFIQMIGRVATDVERYTWSTRLLAGGTERTIVESLAGSSAFADRVAASAY